jgi:hypothetical protein
MSLTEVASLSKRIARKWYGIAMKLGILISREIKQSGEQKK